MNKTIGSLLLGFLIMAVVAMSTSTTNSSVASADSSEPSGDCAFALLSGSIEDVSQVDDKVHFSAPTHRMGTYQMRCDGVPLTMSTREAYVEVDSLPVYDGLFRFEFGHRESLMLYYDEDAGLIVSFGDIMTFIEPGLHGYGIISRPGLQQLWIDDELVGETHNDLSEVALWPWSITVGAYDGELSSIMTYAQEEFLPGVKVVEEPIEEPVVVDPTTKERRIQCTGSMDPNIVCIDTVTVRFTNIHPRDINVGTALVYEPFEGCLTYAPNIEVLHRVIETRGTDSVNKEFLTQGDNKFGNTIDDGCWIPFTSVRGYVVNVEKGTDPEQVSMSNLVMRWEGKAIVMREELFDAGLAVYLEEERLFQCNKVLGANCSTDHLDTLKAQYDAIDEEYDNTLDYIKYLRGLLTELVFGYVNP